MKQLVHAVAKYLENDKSKASMDSTHRYFVKASFREDDCSDAVNEASENPMAISNLFPDTKFTEDMDNFIRNVLPFITI